eukprot:XP_001706582.1 Hypothetical protein GL50803_36117 [Giardia lamblia ATCC 50803]
MKAHKRRVNGSRKPLVRRDVSSVVRHHHKETTGILFKRNLERVPFVLVLAIRDVRSYERNWIVEAVRDPEVYSGCIGKTASCRPPLQMDSAIRIDLVVRLGKCQVSCLSNPSNHELDRGNLC